MIFPEMTYPGMESASPTHAAHDFIKDEKGTVAVADISYGLKVARERCYAAKCLDGTI